MLRKILITLIITACFGTAAGAQEKTVTRLLYWNIQNGMWCGQGDNYDAFVSFVKSNDPDICVWCEGASIYYTDTATPFATNDEKYLPYNWDSLAERYGHKYVYVGGWRDDYPQVITSKYPIRNVKRILGDEDDVIVSHGAAWARIGINGDTLNIVTLHTWPHRYAYRAEDQQKSAGTCEGHTYRAREVRRICEETVLSDENAGGQLWMMMGDFNSKSRVDNSTYGFPEDSSLFKTHDYIRENTPYIDVINAVHNGEFFTTCGSRNRIDFIYCTAPMLDRITGAEVFKPEGYLKIVRDPQQLSNFYHPSDHLPIMVIFDM